MNDNSSKPFPLKAKVVLTGLKAVEFNDQIGIVQGPLNSEGRQSVYVESLNKTVALKVANLQYQARDLDSLSIKELKTMLRFKQTVLKFQGMDKSDLRAKLEELTTDSMEIAECLAQANAGGNIANTSADSPLDEFENMRPELLRQQAQMMRSMPPATIRATNPQLAHMSDAQIQQAALKMEMMAANPEMMEQTRQQIMNLTPAQRQQYEQMIENNYTANANDDAMTSKQDHLANLTPDQWRQQAQMMRNMPPDSLRQLNPQLAAMTDEQINQAASQMEMLAANPELMKVAAEQMKKLTPQQMQDMLKGGGAINNSTLNPMAMGMPSNNASPQQDGTLDPAKLLETMDPKQIKDMMTMLKNNPDALAQMAAQSGMPKEGLQQTLEMFSNMSENQLETSLKTMAKVQKATATVQNVWKKCDALVGGHLKLLLIVAIVTLLSLSLLYYLGGESGSRAASKVLQEHTKVLSLGSTPHEIPEMTVEDEFSEL